MPATLSNRTGRTEYAPDHCLSEHLYPAGDPVWSDHARGFAVAPAEARGTSVRQAVRRYGLAGRLAPGILLSAGVAALAAALAAVEIALAGRAWLEALVLAILVGSLIRTAWRPGALWQAGIDVSARLMLEMAVALLGASVSTRALVQAGPGLLGGIAAVVLLAIGASYGMGRVLGLGHRMAALVACGNSICGNSAIAAVAPVIGADGDDVACSIAFTAALGIIVVLALPLAVPLLHLSQIQYGAFAGLTVYAVPQVLAATAPVGPIALQFGTLVKLVRVLMLGPVVFGLSLVASLRDRDRVCGRLDIFRLIPWFILVFLALAGMREEGYLPHAVLAPVAVAANGLTMVSMAALGLSTDLRMVALAGPRVISAVVASLLILGAVSLALIRVLGVS